LTLSAVVAPAKIVAEMATKAGDLEERVRARLRQVRFERGLSLTAVAHASGLAASTVSRLETGVRRLTLMHVAHLARAMDVSTDELLATDPRQPATDDPPRSRDGKTWEAVGPERTTGARVYRVGIPVELRQPALHSHEGHQWLYVLQGSVRLIVEHHHLVLNEGEAAEFQTWRPHWLGAIDHPAEALVIFTPDGRPVQPISPWHRPSRSETA
jgi:transcriptional regulator with XRE-family HTH domain